MGPAVPPGQMAVELRRCCHVSFPHRPANVENSDLARRVASAVYRYV